MLGSRPCLELPLFALRFIRQAALHSKTVHVPRLEPLPATMARCQPEKLARLFDATELFPTLMWTNIPTLPGCSKRLKGSGETKNMENDNPNQIPYGPGQLPWEGQLPSWVSVSGTSDNPWIHLTCKFRSANDRLMRCFRKVS